jgi:hypothetical protein
MVKWRLSVRGVLVGVAVVSFGLALGFSARSMRLSGVVQAATAQEMRTDVPAYHSALPKGELPLTVPPDHYANDPVTMNAYTLAGKIRKTLYQLPCYCNCDREAGHTSLLDCYRGSHGSFCDVCKKELFYAYLQTKKGKSVAQIRKEIIAGNWQAIQTSDWATLPPEHNSKQK